MSGVTMVQPAALDTNVLPRDPVARRGVLELRATPNGDKPKLPAVTEAQLAQTEEKTAQCYLQNEENTYRLRCLAKKIHKTEFTRNKS